MKKIGLFFGGMSNESEVSIHSAKNVERYIDVSKYQLIPIFWDKLGNFYRQESISVWSLKIQIEDFKDIFDIALLMTHWKYWEDGVLQSIFEIQKIPYCGCRVLSSALCMDKLMIKQLFVWAGIPQVPFDMIDLKSTTEGKGASIVESFSELHGFPLYIKPANSGSSVWITKVEHISDIRLAIQEAAKHDSKVVIEKGLISPQEIEMAVVGNSDLLLSEPWELILTKDFYDYEDKYKNNQTNVVIPAHISEVHRKYIKELTQKVYTLCDCKWFARVDFFIADGSVYLNEINTLPWFTDISMFPMLMMNTWLSYTEVITKIIDLAY